MCTAVPYFLQVEPVASGERFQLAIAPGGEVCSWGLRLAVSGWVLRRVTTAAAGPAASRCSSNCGGRRGLQVKTGAGGGSPRRSCRGRRAGGLRCKRLGGWPRPSAVLSRRTDHARTEGGSSGLACHHGGPSDVLPAIPHRSPASCRVHRRPAPPPADSRCGSPLLSASCRSPPVPQPAGMSLLQLPAPRTFLICLIGSLHLLFDWLPS